MWNFNYRASSRDNHQIETSICLISRLTEPVSSICTIWGFRPGQCLIDWCVSAFVRVRYRPNRGCWCRFWTLSRIGWIKIWENRMGLPRYHLIMFMMYSRNTMRPLTPRDLYEAMLKIHRNASFSVLFVIVPSWEINGILSETPRLNWCFYKSIKSKY